MKDLYMCCCRNFQPCMCL